MPCLNILRKNVLMQISCFQIKILVFPHFQSLIMCISTTKIYLKESVLLNTLLNLIAVVLPLCYHLEVLAVTAVNIRFSLKDLNI